MQVGKKLIVVVLILFILFTLAFFAFILVLYRPQAITSILFGGNLTAPIPFENRTENGTSVEKSVESTIRRNIVRLKEGIRFHPSFVLKVREEGNSTQAYLVAVDPMEWEFVKGSMESGVAFGNLKRVLRCGKVYVLDFDITGMWIPQVSLGEVSKEGFSVYLSENGTLQVAPFEGKCFGNCFVFNEDGDLSGICYGDAYFPLSPVYEQVPDGCKEIFRKEVENGNIQSENGLLVR